MRCCGFTELLLTICEQANGTCGRSEKWSGFDDGRWYLDHEGTKRREVPAAETRNPQSALQVFVIFVRLRVSVVRTLTAPA